MHRLGLPVLRQSPHVHPAAAWRDWTASCPFEACRPRGPVHPPLASVVHCRHTICHHSRSRRRRCILCLSLLFFFFLPPCPDPRFPVLFLSPLLLAQAGLLHLGAGATGGSSSIMQAFSSRLVHFPLAPAWLCLRCCRKWSARKNFLDKLHWRNL